MYRQECKLVQYCYVHYMTMRPQHQVEQPLQLGWQWGTHCLSDSLKFLGRLRLKQILGRANRNKETITRQGMYAEGQQKKTFVCEAIESNLLSEWIQFKDQAKSLWQSDLDLQDQTHHRRLLKLAKNPYPLGGATLSTSWPPTHTLSRIPEIIQYIYISNPKKYY